MTKISKTAITHNGKRVGVRYTAGPWAAGVDPATIKVRPKCGTFPASFREAFVVENNSNGSEDYFEVDCIRLLPGHPLYDQVRSVL